MAAMKFFYKSSTCSLEPVQLWVTIVWKQWNVCQPLPRVHRDLTAACVRAVTKCARWVSSRIWVWTPGNAVRTQVRVKSLPISKPESGSFTPGASIGQNETSHSLLPLNSIFVTQDHKQVLLVFRVPYKTPLEFLTSQFFFFTLITWGGGGEWSQPHSLPMEEGKFFELQLLLPQDLQDLCSVTMHIIHVRITAIQAVFLTTLLLTCDKEVSKIIDVHQNIHIRAAKRPQIRFCFLKGKGVISGPPGYPKVLPHFLLANPPGPESPWVPVCSSEL